jgi:two-component system response regulator
MGAYWMNPIGTDIRLGEERSEQAEPVIQALRLENVITNLWVVRGEEEASALLFCRGRVASRSFNQPSKRLLLDLKLPKVDGIEVLKPFKGDPRTRVIPAVILISSKKGRGCERSCDLVANSQSPVNFDHFQKIVQTVGLGMGNKQRQDVDQAKKSAGQGSP